MTPLANGAAALLGFWLVANTCYVIGVPGIFHALKRVNGFRTFARWTMFGEPPDPERSSAYMLEYRDQLDGGPATWHVAGRSDRRNRTGFLLDPSRPAAEALRALGVWLEVTLDRRTTPQGAATLRRIERVLGCHLDGTRPLADGKVRDIRVVKIHRWLHDDPDPVWQFTMKGRGGDA